jgi:NAD(P)-dependent dehydrogenase (short-subunit alcohol dehydrogenase family)
VPVRELWNRTWNVNVTSTQIVTTTFAPLLLKSSDPRLIFMTSGTATLAGTDNFDVPWNKVPAKGWPKTGSTHSISPSYAAYRSSKTGLNMMMRCARSLSLFYSSVPRGEPRTTNLEANGVITAHREWYRYLKEDGVKVWAVSPGYLATGIGGGRERNIRQGAADPAIGGNFVRDVLEGKRDGDVGKAILREMVQPW